MTSLDTSALLDVLDDLFFVFDEAGTFHEWNRAAVDRTGYRAEALSTMGPGDLFSDPDADRLREAVSKVQEGGKVSVEVDLLTADGESVPYEFTVSRIGDVEGTRYVGIGRDRSEWKEAERERRQLLNRMSDAVFALDSEWRITYANDAAAAILAEAMDREPDAAQLEGLHIWEEVPEAVGTTFYERYHEALATQEVVTFEEYYEPLGRWLDVRAYPSESGLSIYFYDSTDRHRRQEQVRNRERVLREMYEIIANRDLAFDEQVQSLLALGRAELDVDYGSLSHISGEDYTFEVVDAVDEQIQAGDEVPLSATNCEIAARNEQTLVLGDVARDAPDETDRAGYAEWDISCYIGAPVYVEEEVYGTFCFYDTEPRQAEFSEWEITLVDLLSRWVSYELQRQAANERLHQQNERLERFASIVSHDLRNPLNVATGSLELAEGTEDSEQLQRASRALERMDTLIDDLLTLARSGSAIDDPELVHLDAIAERSWSNVATEAAALAVESDRSLQADATRLQQLLENLFRNAVEHGGETVTVTVGALPDGFYVEDDGTGIAADVAGSVLESGFTTSSDGTGFGLAIVEEIAEAHGWQVTVTSGTEGGARFEFRGVSG